MKIHPVALLPVLDLACLINSSRAFEHNERERGLMIDEYDEYDLAGVDMQDPFENGIFVPLKHMSEFEEKMIHNSIDNSLEEDFEPDDEEISDSNYRYLKQAIKNGVYGGGNEAVEEGEEYPESAYYGGRNHLDYNREYYQGEYGGYGGYGTGSYGGAYGGYAHGGSGYVKPYYKKNPFRKPLLSQLLWCFRPDFNAGLGSGGIYRKMKIDKRFVPIQENERHLAEDLKLRRCFKFGVSDRQSMSLIYKLKRYVS